MNEAEMELKEARRKRREEIAKAFIEEEKREMGFPWFTTIMVTIAAIFGLWAFIDMTIALFRH